MKPIQQISKAINTNKDYIKKSIVLHKMQEERLISNLINEHFASLKVS